jgi:hypothetical protein
MKPRFSILLTSLVALALAAPGTMAKEKDKGKDKKKDKVERVDRERDGRDGHDDRDGRHDRDGRDGRDDDDRDGNGRITICHIPPGNASARHTITVSESAWNAHRNHGDRRGACDQHGNGDGRDAFDRLDRNNDHRLAPGEWPHGSDSFRRLDRDGDGFLSRGEYSRY